MTAATALRDPPHPEWAQLKRLDFLLPDFTRMSWTTDEARAIWSPRLHRLTNAWQDIEWLAVAHGVRRCGLTTVGAEYFPDKAPAWVEHDLNALPLAVHGTSESYSSTTVTPRIGEPFAYRIVVGAPEDVKRFKHAMDECDDRAIGALLGYPECCTDFFRSVWVEHSMVDTTWPMSTTGGAGDVLENEVDIPAGTPLEANILWRWMGARAVPHLPCAFDCEPTEQLGKALVQVGRDCGFEQEMDWLLEMLSWPVEWSALHGIAEIKTPVLKVSSRTDATPVKYVVRKHGDRYPREGAAGLKFPYRKPARRGPTATRAFDKGLSNPIEEQPALPEWYASDNGFPTRDHMDNAHRPIVQLVNDVLHGRAGATVIDLGCGNGALLRKISRDNPSVTPHGVELDPERYRHALELDANQADRIQLGNMFDDPIRLPDAGRYDLALLMPGRLLEVEAENAQELRQWIVEHCRQLVVYAYGDWLTRYDDLAGLASRAGLKLLADGAGPTTALAEIDKPSMPRTPEESSRQ